MRKAGFGLLLLAALGCQSRASHQPLIAPDFSLKDLSGKSVNLASFRGHPVLLDFWATWCGPCRQSIPMVQAFYLKNKDHGLVTLGLNVDQDPSGVYSFVKQMHMTYPVLLAGNSAVSDHYAVEGIPLFILVAPDGHVIRRYEGFDPAMVEDWEEELRKLSPPKS
jgi:thiol-disulfide isomerase/thioredoxin